jgi:hypothetical protein
MNRLMATGAAALLFATTSVRAEQLTWVEDLSAPDSATYQFTDVRVIGADVYMSGYARSGLAGFVWKRIGGVWSDMNISNVSFVNSIHGTSGSDLWVGGNSGVHHYDGANWSGVAAGVGQEVKNIVAIDASNVVALGAGGSIRQTVNGGIAWTTISGGNGGTTVGLLANATDDIWIGGNDGQSYMEHWDGASYDVTPGYTSPGSFVQAIFQNGTNIYASGTGGEAWRWDAGTMAFVSINYMWNNFASARDVVVDDSGDAWFVGDRSHVFHYDGDTGAYDLQDSAIIPNGVTKKNSGNNSYTSIAIHNNNVNLIVVGSDGVWEAEIPIVVPFQVAFSNITVSDTIGFQFASEQGSNYVLQCSSNGATYVSKNFTIHGQGIPDEITFDPNGYDSNKTYRIIIAE